jgi:peptidoglycan/LPS O-acetylase OafA/YrhL
MPVDDLLAAGDGGRIAADPEGRRPAWSSDAGALTWSWPWKDRRRLRWRLTEWRTFATVLGLSLLQLVVGLATGNRYIAYFHAAFSVCCAALVLLSYRASRPRVPWHEDDAPPGPRP